MHSEFLVAWHECATTFLHHCVSLCLIHFFIHVCLYSRLLSARGIPALKSYFSDALFKGKGYEVMPFIFVCLSMWSKTS